jgi:hypothetical protein
VTFNRTALRHNAFTYESPDEYVARAVLFLTKGLESGEGAIVTHTKPGLAMMRETLGSGRASAKGAQAPRCRRRPVRS